jgi:quinol monooxygenase YgiN
MSNVAYLVEMTIADGKQAEFEKLANGYTEAVQAGENDTLEYQWWLAEDGSRALLKETHHSSESLLQHLANVGPSLPELLAIAPFTRFEVFGDVSADVRTAMDDFNAVYFSHVVGFQR